MLAPDKFKGSLTSGQVAEALAAGLPADWDVVRVPVADGGDGTVDAAVAAGFDRVPVTASGPTGEPVQTSYARRGDVAVVELADVCGLARLPGGRPAPMDATSRGLGEVMARAVAAGARRLVVGIGGSASTDGGRGMRDALAGVDLSGVELVVASDVTNPLLGPDGAAAVYGPQKGATPEQVDELERRLDGLGGRGRARPRRHPGRGRRGRCRLRPAHARRDAASRASTSSWTLSGSPTLVRDADLVITGEGALDAQTLQGKAPAGVARAARAAGVAVRRGRGHEQPRRHAGRSTPSACSATSSPTATGRSATRRRC